MIKYHALLDPSMDANSFQYNLDWKKVLNFDELQKVLLEVVVDMVKKSALCSTN